MFRRAQDMHDIAGAMRNSVNLVLVKALFHHRRIAAINEFLMAHRLRRRFATFVFAEQDESNAGDIQRGVAAPVALAAPPVRKLLRNKL
jgi:hypothetical protein